VDFPRPAAPLSIREARQLAADRQWQRLAERAGADGGLDLAPEAALHVADSLWRVGRTPDGLRLAESIETAIRASGDRRLLLDLINILGITLFQLGRMEDAAARFADLLDRSAEWRDDEFAARASNNLGVIANVRGHREMAITSYERSLAAYQRMGYVRGLAQTHHNLAISYRDLGLTDKSDAHFVNAIGFASRAESEDIIAFAETERAMLQAQLGDGELAESMACVAMRRFERLGDLARRGEVLRVRAAAARARADDRAAVDFLDEALRIATAHSSRLLEAEIHRDRGILLRDRGDYAEARADLERAIAAFDALGAGAEAANVRGILGEL
jgi:tetratricopeptide (TPR) repeat protein